MPLLEIKWGAVPSLAVNFEAPSLFFVKTPVKFWVSSLFVPKWKQGIILPLTIPSEPLSPGVLSV